MKQCLGRPPGNSHRNLFKMADIATSYNAGAMNQAYIRGGLGAHR